MLRLLRLKLRKLAVTPFFRRASDRSRRVALGRLDLDHVGTEVAEHHRAKRSGDDLGKIQNAKTCQRSISHRYYLKTR